MNLRKWSKATCILLDLPVSLGYLLCLSGVMNMERGIYLGDVTLKGASTWLRKLIHNSFGGWNFETIFLHQSFTSIFAEENWKSPTEIALLKKGVVLARFAAIGDVAVSKACGEGYFSHIDERPSEAHEDCKWKCNSSLQLLECVLP
ncbi:hypothetical protein Pelo_10177 [Pelomyxa schiedti]|nr:hypothetical protein Pelo_10177 [Pelomyxa schiedti]